MSLAVNIVCRNWQDDRVIPRFSRYLRDHLGWMLTARPLPGADVYYLSGYFEWPFMKAADLMGAPTAAYFTHREEEPPGNGKARQFDEVARRVSLRIATAAMYAGPLAECGPTAQVWPPVERERFVPASTKGAKVVAGFSGYTYSNGRKGEDLARKLVAVGWLDVEWRASGRGWPVQTRRYTWAEMPAFYQSLDVLVVTSLVEGVPMPALEALACGCSLVIPRGVGLLDELPDVAGIHRYKRGDAGDLVRVFSQAVKARPEVAAGTAGREALRAVTEPYTVLAWCEQHRAAFEEVFC